MGPTSSRGFLGHAKITPVIAVRNEMRGMSLEVNTVSPAGVIIVSRGTCQTLRDVPTWPVFRWICAIGWLPLSIGIVNATPAVPPEITCNTLTELQLVYDANDDLTTSGWLAKSDPRHPAAFPYPTFQLSIDSKTHVASINPGPKACELDQSTASTYVVVCNDAIGEKQFTYRYGIDRRTGTYSMWQEMLDAKTKHVERRAHAIGICRPSDKPVL